MTGDSGSVQSKDSSGVAQQIEVAPLGTEFRSPDQPTNIPEVERQLTDLIESYRIALRFVARLPTFGRLDTTLESRLPTVVDGKLTKVPPKDSKRRVARPFVRLFVESHIRHKLKVIHRLLSIEAISLDEQDPHAKKVALWVKRLQETRESMRSLGRTYSLLTRAPLVSLLLPFLGAFLLQVTRVDVSNPNEIMKTAVTLVQTQRTSLLLVLSNAALLLVYIYILLAPAVIRFGFRCKRAIFNGGKTDSYRLLWGQESESRDEIWNNFPAAKIYAKENQLFAELGANKPEEFPLDLIASPLPYTILIIASAFTLYAWRDFASGTSPHVVQLGVLVVLWLVLIGIIWNAGKLYQRRKKERAM